MKQRSQKKDRIKRKKWLWLLVAAVALLCVLAAVFFAQTPQGALFLALITGGQGDSLSISDTPPSVPDSTTDPGSAPLSSKLSTLTNALKKDEPTDQNTPPTKNGPAPTITLTIECKTATNAGSDFAKNISNEGVMYPKTTLKLPKGATVEDALKQSGISYQADYGYVSAIAKLSAGAVGEESSWFYSVNGTYPQESFNQYFLQDGDVVIWRYSLDTGQDIGAR